VEPRFVNTRARSGPRKTGKKPSSGPKSTSRSSALLPQSRVAPARAWFALAALLSFWLLAFAVMAGQGGWSPGGEEVLEALVRRTAAEYGVDPHLAHAVIDCESGGRPDAVSRAGAVGLMQLMPGTARAVAAELDLPSPDERDLFDPEVNVRLGVYYLSKMLNLFEDKHLALAAYNAGPTNVRRWQARNPGCDGAVVVSRSGFGETRHYVRRVLRAWNSRKEATGSSDNK
jgi:soluble lytic murein transglycosylase